MGGWGEGQFLKIRKVSSFQLNKLWLLGTHYFPSVVFPGTNKQHLNSTESFLHMLCSSGWITWELGLIHVETRGVAAWRQYLGISLPQWLSIVEPGRFAREVLPEGFHCPRMGSLRSRDRMPWWRMIRVVALLALRTNQWWKGQSLKSWTPAV